MIDQKTSTLIRNALWALSAEEREARLLLPLVSSIGFEYSSLSEAQLRYICHALAMELTRSGLGQCDEPNDRGREIENAIDSVLQLVVEAR